MPEVAGDAAFLVDPFDIRDIQRGLTDALAVADSARASAAARSVEHAARFSWSRCASSVVDLYRSRLAQ
jgi:glycosyltransferase involved in cell wall biosynthesis